MLSIPISVRAKHLPQQGLLSRGKLPKQRLLLPLWFGDVLRVSTTENVDESL